MSTAVAAGSPFLPWNDAYEPVSEGSRAIQRLSANHANIRRGSATDWSPIVEAALLDIRKECSVRNWDGVDTRPVTDQTIKLAGRVIKCLFAILPGGIPAPDVVPEHDGEICITWTVDDDRVFSLSVGPHGKINFSGQFGKEGSIHGWKPINPTSHDLLEKSLKGVAGEVAKLYPEYADGSILRRAA